MGYALAGFATFTRIWGRHNNHQSKNNTSTRATDSCCAILKQDAVQGFLYNLETAFMNFVLGLQRLSQIHNQQSLKIILKNSLFILVTAV
jgi:hypothetical protein